MYWNCLFPPLNIFLDSHKVFEFLVTLLYVIGKKVIFSVFGYSICSVVPEANAAYYMVWRIPNMYFM